MSTIDTKPFTPAETEIEDDFDFDMMDEEKMQENLELEGSIVGFDFTPDMKLVYQTFSVVYK